MAIEIVHRPVTNIAVTAHNLDQLAKMLPADARLPRYILPESTGLAEMAIDLDAVGPADALQKMALAVELLIAAVGGLDAIGPLHHATVVQRTTVD